ncbi:diguanylate cyclase/phosphodiesterase (GGDEF & EAL domains) with PAS/PAC sensor(s) [hydrothermal vent metagenome]|uniref:Diguanylate cyclase/phosphodiesterase (GGDEF & EAL domains) with PAS/PAC sensor(S) n=1 Tax=hydrothermal vent metagenome TaxID=652676 RepID=A0A3B1C7W3_9ZZZZ
MLKRFLIVFLPVAILLSGFVWYLHRSELRAEMALVELQLNDDVASKASNIKAHFKNIMSDLEFLSELHTLRRFASESPQKSEDKEGHYSIDLENDLKSVSLRKGLYDQIRYISSGGMELMRVNYNGGKPVVAERRELQNKAGRYYIEKLAKLGKGEFFISRLDLNVENNIIQKPYKPVIRLGTPVFGSGGERHGILIFNFMAGDLLKEFEMVSGRLSAGDSHLVNSEEYWLAGPEPEDKWGFLFADRKKKTFGRAFPAAWQKINARKSGQFYIGDDLFTFTTVYPDLMVAGSDFEPVAGASSGDAVKSWKIIFRYPVESLFDIADSKRGDLLNNMAQLYAILLLMLGAGAFVIARTLTVRREAEVALHESELRIRKLSEAAFEGIATTEKGKIIEYNDTFATMFGYTDDNMMGISVLKLSAPEDRAIVSANIAKGYEGIFEVKGLRKDGSVFPIEVHGIAAPYLGRSVRVTAIRDITERKQAEEALYKSERNLAEAQKIARMGSFNWNMIDRTARWSRGMCSVFGVDYDSFNPTYQNFLDMVHPDDRESVDEVTQQSFKGVSPRDFTFRIIRPDKVKRILEYSCKITMDYEGKAIEMIGTVLDITERKQAEDDISKMFSLSPDMIWAGTLDGILTNVNPASKQILGYETYDLIGKSFLEMLHPEDVEQTKDELAAALRGVRNHYIENRYRCKNGDCKWIGWTAQSIVSEGTFYAIGRDITEQKESKELASRFGRILENSSNEIFIFDADSLKFIQVSQGALNNLGYTIEEIRKLTVLDLKTESTRESFTKMTKPLRSGEKESIFFITAHTRKDGSTYPVEVRLQFSTDETLPIFIAVLQDITEREEADEALKLQKGYLDKLQDSIAEPILSVKMPERVMMSVNRALETVFGYTAEECIGESTIMIYQDEKGYFEFASNIAEAIRSGKDAVYSEQLLKRKNGELFPCEIMSSFIMKDGKVTEVISIIKDITERKKVEDALRESEEKYRSVAQSANDAIISADMGEKIISWNKGARQVFGYNEAEALGRPLTTLIPKQFRKAHLAGFHRFISTGEKRIMDKSIELKGLRKDGSEFPLELSLSSWTTDKGRFITAIIRDITERAQAEEKLRESEQRMRKLSEAAFEGIVVAEKGKVIESNDIFAKLFGYTKDELIGKLVTDLISPEDVGVVSENIAKGYEDVYEAKGLKKDGSNFVIEIRGIATPYHGRTAHITAIRDITERKKAESDIAHSLSLTQAIIESTVDGILVVGLDGRISSVNKKFQEIWRIPDDVIAERSDYKTIGCVLNQLKYPDAFLSKIRELYSKPEESSIDILEFADGRIIERNSLPQRIGDDVVGRVWSFRDITERKQAEEKLKLSAMVFDNASEGVIVTDSAAIIQYVNPSFTQITEYEPKEAIGRNPSILKSIRHDKAFYDEMWRCLIKEGEWKGEIWNRKKNGEPYVVRQSINAIKDSDGKTIQYASIFQDITEIKQSADAIEYHAYHDLLTGLPNRLLFVDRLEQVLGRASRDKQRFALLFVDIDDFKKINDNFGHAVGDLLIKGMGTRLTTCVRETDTVCRYAGDEFIMIVENVKSETDIAPIAEKILESLSEPYMHQGKKIFSTVSIGIAIYPADGDSVEELVKNADFAMYNVKEQNKNNYRFFTKELNEEATRRFALEQKMREAVENDEFVVHYQPKISLSSGYMDSMEALVRWKRGADVVSPASFIPLAEKTDLIIPIGERVLFMACEQLKAWNDKGRENLSVSVNISARQMDKGNLLEVIKSTLATTGTKPECLCLEVTETAIMENMDTALATLEAIKKMGVKISLDDFGTGYSSLSHLRKFPIDEIKIDRFFVMNIPDDKEDSAIATSIIAMAQSLNLNVVAEGVETKAQLDFLKDAGCDEAQGYLFSRPVPPEEIGQLLGKGKTDNLISK